MKTDRTDYVQFLEDLLVQGKTTGPNQSETLVHYTRLNLQRTKRWMLKGVLSRATIDKIQSISKPQHWVFIAEGWCSDVAHAYPFIYKMAEINPLIRFEWKLRDENLDLIDQYLTNGGRAIPKLIVYDENEKELFNWGPRPEFIQKYYKDNLSLGIPKTELMNEIQKLYNADKGMTIQQEIISLLP